MMRSHSGMYPEPVSDYEEQVWLYQQQNPDCIMKHIAGWQIRNPQNITPLFDALRQLIAGVPDFNVRYTLSNEGELTKYSAPEWQSCIEFIAAESYPAAVEHILARQAQPWDPQRDAPFSALIIRSGKQALLVLLVHEIAAPAANEAAILRFMERACAGEAPAAFALERPALLLPDAFSAPAAPWLRRSRDTAAIASAVPGREDSAADSGLAMRWKITLGAASLRVQARGDGTRRGLQTGIILHAARFISRYSGTGCLPLCLLAEDGPRSLTLDVADDDALLAAAVDRALDLPAEPLPGGTAPVFIRLLPEPGGREDPLWPGEPLLLPTRAPCPDIELALETSGTERVTLILTLGQGVRVSAGEYLLESLAAFLQDEDAAAFSPVPAQDVEAPAAAEHPARSNAAAAAAAILAEFRAVLNAPEMTTDDDFFDWGGHSLLATRVTGRLLSAHGLEVRFADFFRYPTAAALAPHALPTAVPERDRTSAPEAPDDASAPLALAQHSLWQAYRAYGFGTIFNLPFALDLQDSVDEARLEAALGDILERHPSLRALYFERDGEGRQRAVDIGQLANYKWFWRSSESQGVTLEDEAAWRFDLARELPLRVRVLHNPSTGRQALSLLIHHMAIDEWSLNVIMEELSRAYAARGAGSAPVWQKPALDFFTVARRQRAAGVDPQHLAYWTRMLRDATRGLALAQPNNDDSAGADASAAGWLELRPRPEVTRGLYSLARKRSASLFTVAYAAIALALHKLGNLRDIAIGTSASGRTDRDTYETVGYFTTMVAHRVTFDPRQTAASLIAAVRDTVNESMACADVPMDIIQQSLGMAPEEGLLFDVYIQIHASNALNGTLRDPQGGDVRYRQIDADKKASMFGLQFEIMEDVIDGEKRLRLVITYRTGHYPTPLARQISAAVEAVFTLFATSETLDIPLAEVAL